MITSTANKQVKNIIQLTKKAKERQIQKVFLAEGMRIFEEIPKEYLQNVYVSESFLQKKENTKKLDDIEYETVSDTVFQRMSDTKTPQGVLCIVRQPEYEWKDLIRGEQTHLLVLEGIQDPGNLGTMFRTGEGAGITGIIMSGCADLFAPKTVRSTEETARWADAYLKIPMGGCLESLNAAMAAGILMYEVNRQRRGEHTIANMV